ncbi:MAG: M42 family metallopeptidase [Fimbriimonadaceae bacterium]|nr:M42 family metallopeptidase [Fimbriimonadaceae bacterium]QYK57533.1 MAG: M42 family metallopeptidase [Fimbriimonadaceae bacterium]
MRDESLEFFKAIVDAPSPSGFEQPAARVFRDYTSKFADEVVTDVHGNTWAALNPKAEARVMLAGHMDEIGFQVAHITDDGLIYFMGIGGHDSMVPLGQRVWIHGRERVPGVISRKPVHLLENSEKDKRPELHDLWIDIGAKNKEEAEAVVSIGDPVTYQWEFQHLMGDRVCARGFDNKMGAFVVAEALRLVAEKGAPEGVGVFAVATVQEEVGLRGAKTSAYAIGAQSGLAVDVDFAIDVPGLAKTRYGVADMGKGPTVTRGSNINPVVFETLMTVAKEDGINVQVAAWPGGTGTDANAMQLNQSGMATGLVGVPIRYMHTPCELLELRDVEDCARLMAGYCLRVRPDTDFTPR